MATQLVSIQVGGIKAHTLSDGTVWETGYEKLPIHREVSVRKLGLEGDAQKLLKVHGGEHRAILLYGADHYTQWRTELETDLRYGSFGENLDITGLDESNVYLGDIYAIGDQVRVQVSQPRQPCNAIYKYLKLRGIQQQVDRSRRTGWYVRVLAEGVINASMPVTLLERPYPQWSVWQAHDIMEQALENKESAHELATCEALSPGWRQTLAKV